MNTFKVGEIVILQNVLFNPELSGEEVEITEGLHMFRGNQTGEVKTGYSVRVRDGRVFGAEPHQLRKKRPPQREIDAVVSWKDCAWKPQGVPA